MFQLSVVLVLKTRKRLSHEDRVLELASFIHYYIRVFLQLYFTLHNCIITLYLYLYYYLYLYFNIYLINISYIFIFHILSKLKF